jgi:UvrD-like helicase C-terminal domain
MILGAAGVLITAPRRRKAPGATRTAPASSSSHALSMDRNTIPVNFEEPEIRSYLCRQGQFPCQVGTEDFDDARQDIEQLPLLQDQQAVALAAVDRLQALVPTLSPAVLTQVRGRILPGGLNLSRAGTEASRLLHALEHIYAAGRGAYFASIVAALEECNDAGHHLPRIEAVRTLRVTAQALSSKPVNFEYAIDQYAAAVQTAAHTAPRMDYGLFVMTAHQAKGKEFEAIILADAMQRFWPDDDDTRRLFYVAVTRASKSWTIVAPDRDASPLLRHLRCV